MWDAVGVRIEQLIEPYSNLPLECDGMTRVITYLLTRAGISHQVMQGSVTVAGKGTFPLHYWVELPDGKVIDYRSRMWFEDDPSIPEGVFDPTGTNIHYSGRTVDMAVDDFIFRALTETRGSLAREVLEAAVTCTWCGKTIDPQAADTKTVTDAGNVEHYFHPSCWKEYRAWYTNKEKK